MFKKISNAQHEVGTALVEGIFSPQRLERQGRDCVPFSKLPGP